MNKGLPGILIGIAALAIVATGVMAAGWFWTGRVGFWHGPMMAGSRSLGMMPTWFGSAKTTGTSCGQVNGNNQSYGGSMHNRGFGSMMGGQSFSEMMGSYRGSAQGNGTGSCQISSGGSTNPTGARLTLDDAKAKMEAYLAGEANLKLAEIMEFQDNFYGVVLEKDSERGAMELLLDPYTGSVYPEHGPNMMWNEKYGHMGGWYATTAGTLTLNEAKVKAQAALDNLVPGASVEETGSQFYGYFTLDYTVNGQIAGMLSVHNNGQTFVHTWHGAFMAEVELD